MNSPGQHPPLPYSLLRSRRIARLDELAADLWWSWHPEARAVFRRLDYHCGAPPRTIRCGCCGSFRAATLEAAAADAAFLATYDRAIAALDDARAAQQHVVDNSLPASRRPDSIAYFSAEFALHQSLPIYAGGLGVLAGDHCKEASDLGVPLDRRRVHVSAGILPPARLRGRLAGGKLRATDLGRRADRAGADARRQAVHHRRAARRSHRCSSRCGVCGSAG